MPRHRGIISRLSPSMKVLVASIFLIVFMIVILLWTMNKGPDFPAISYVPEIKVMEDIYPSTGDHKKNPLLSRLNEDTYGNAINANPGLKTMTEIPAGLSDEEKVKIISEKYKLIFYNLKTAYEKELDRMIKYAKNDYLAAKNGQIDISYAKMAMEYMKVGRDLESDSDQRFDVILKEMKKELNAHNLPLDVAKQAEKEYNAQKDRAKKEILVKIARLGG